jgi:hypothetical protein
MSNLTKEKRIACAWKGKIAILVPLAAASIPLAQMQARSMTACERVA